MTPKLKLPQLAVNQAQKEVTHNEALNILDVLTMPSVINATTTAPPGAPAEGDAYVIAAGATGAWAGKSGQIAAYFSGWKYHVPAEGWAVWDRAADILLRHDGAQWRGSPAAQVPALALGWIGYGGGYAGPRYYKAADGRVTIEGLMQAGTDGTVFTLLAGYRPAEKLMFVCWSGGGAYRVEVEADGDVIVTASNAVFSSLSGISFYAA